MYYRTYTVPYSHLLAKLRPMLPFPYRMVPGATTQLHITPRALRTLHGHKAWRRRKACPTAIYVSVPCAYSDGGGNNV